MDKLIAFLLPPLIDVINSNIENSRLRFWVSVVSCAVVATILHYLTHGMIVSGDALSTDMLEMFGIAQLSYQGVWDNSKLLGGLRNTLGLNAEVK